MASIRFVHMLAQVLWFNASASECCEPWMTHRPARGKSDPGAGPKSTIMYLMPSYGSYTEDYTLSNASITFSLASGCSCIQCAYREPYTIDKTSM